jgi:hypothetical protein
MRQMLAKVSYELPRRVSLDYRQQEIKLHTTDIFLEYIHHTSCKLMKAIIPNVS